MEAFLSVVCGVGLIMALAFGIMVMALCWKLSGVSLIMALAFGIMVVALCWKLSGRDRRR